MTSQSGGGHFFSSRVDIYLLPADDDIIGSIFSGQTRSEIDEGCLVLNLEAGLPAPFVTLRGAASSI